MTLGARTMRRLAVLAACTLALSACDDPSNVGLDLLDDEAAAPTTAQIDLPAEALPLGDVTGEADRFLAGSVDDPVLGTIEATSFVDFGISNAAGESFRANAVDALVLRLRLDYVYGDTTSTATLALYASDEERESTRNFRSDTTLALGDLITTFQVDPTAEEIDVPLPAAYLGAVESALRSEDFADEYNGLFLRQADGADKSAVLGFRFAEAELRAVQAGDSVAFPARRSGVATFLQRTTPATLPAGRALLQDGLGPGLVLRPSLERFASSAIHGVRLEVEVDTTINALTPQGFARPRLERLDLFAIAPSGDELFLGQSVRSDESFEFRSADLRSYLQGVALGTQEYDRFELRFDSFFASLNTINTVLVRQDETDDISLRVAFTSVQDESGSE
jgi:hypothetical protein